MLCSSWYTYLSALFTPIRLSPNSYPVRLIFFLFHLISKQPSTSTLTRPSLLIKPFVVQGNARFSTPRTWCPRIHPPKQAAVHTSTAIPPLIAKCLVQQRTCLVWTEWTFASEFRGCATHRGDAAAKISVDAGVEIHRSSTQRASSQRTTREWGVADGTGCRGTGVTWWSCVCAARRWFLVRSW